MSKRKKNKKKRKPRPSSRPIERIDVSITELEGILEHAQKEPLSNKDCDALKSVIDTLVFMEEQLAKKGISITRLRKLLFGASTETLDNLTDDDSKQADDNKEPEDTNQDDNKPPKKRKGHGRNGANAYTGATKIEASHETLKPGDPCPNCDNGTVYKMSEPKRLVRVTGKAPVDATVIELQRLRCNLCGKIFTATAPMDVGPEKYDPESVSMIALLKYGTGVPFNRLKGLQGSLGIPLPASTQWDIVSTRGVFFEGAYNACIVVGAQGKIVHNDDTPMKVVEINTLDKIKDDDGNDVLDRTGIFTSGIVTIGETHQIALFFTGHKHAGENLSDVLKHRASVLTRPIQMCDALSRNMPEGLKTIIGNCLVHGRRKFVDVIEDFPKECHHVLTELATVYKHDKIARDKHLSDTERLAYHQRESGPVMARLKEWMTIQLEKKLVEPNSGLGEAINYMLKHWTKLTLFLREPGAPLDNNICERALKKAILNRKNAYYYKTADGAKIGDMYMSLIHTCELNKVNPFDYLTALQKNASAVAICPGDWLPWNYHHALKNEQLKKQLLAPCQ